MTILASYWHSPLFAAGTKEQSGGKTIVVERPPSRMQPSSTWSPTSQRRPAYAEGARVPDYVTPNEALESGELDANFFQHIPYLESFNRERGYHLANAGGMSSIRPLLQEACFDRRTACRGDDRHPQRSDQRRARPAAVGECRA